MISDRQLDTVSRRWRKDRLRVAAKYSNPFIFKKMEFNWKSSFHYSLNISESRSFPNQKDTSLHPTEYQLFSPLAIKGIFHVWGKQASKQNFNLSGDKPMLPRGSHRTWCSLSLAENGKHGRKVAQHFAFLSGFWSIEGWLLFIE